MGIRFVDIRCRLNQDKLPIHHGSVFQGTYFYEDVIKPTVEFLKKNVKETILMLVQYELHGPVKGVSRYCDLVEDALSDASRKNRVMFDVPKTLGGARGRIVLFHKNWPINEPTLGTSLFDYFNNGLHDDWKEHDCPKRWDGAHNHLEQARRLDGCRPMLTYVSGHAEYPLLSPLSDALGLGVVPEVESMANHLNGKLREYLICNQTCRRCLGVVLMDLAPGDIVAALIDRNYWKPWWHGTKTSSFVMEFMGWFPSQSTCKFQALIFPLWFAWTSYRTNSRFVADLRLPDAQVASL